MRSERDRILERRYNLTRRVKLRREAFEHYGMQCKACGFNDLRALQIDHVDDNGAEERRRLGHRNFSGWMFYRWLKIQGWPPGYQTLCANCNAIKQVEKWCGRRELNPRSPRWQRGVVPG